MAVKPGMLLLTLGALLACSALALATLPTTCRLSPMQFDRSTSLVSVGEYTVQFGQPDSTISPRTWEGPVRIHNRQSNADCEVLTAGLIDRPLLYFDDRYLALVTFSGSNYSVETIDLAACAESNSSQKVAGPITFRDGRVLANGTPIRELACAVFQ
jgi:hypothetical protein